MGHGWDPKDGVRRDTGELALFCLVSTGEKTAVCKLRGEPLPETDLPGTLTLDFQLPEL